MEEVVTREEFPMEKALAVLKNETIAIIGYGVQGPAQALNLRDNGFSVIVGQRKGSKTWDKAVAHGWIPGETLFDIEEAAKRGTILEYLLSDAGQITLWPTIKPYLTKGKTLYFSHGFGITFKRRFRNCILHRLNAEPVRTSVTKRIQACSFSGRGRSPNSEQYY